MGNGVALGVLGRGEAIAKGAALGMLGRGDDADGVHERALMRSLRSARRTSLPCSCICSLAALIAAGSKVPCR